MSSFCQSRKQNMGKGRWLLWISPILWILVNQPLVGALPPKPSTLSADQKDPDFTRLQQVLENYGFRLILQPPQRRHTYGLFAASTKTIWINPVVFALGNAQATLVHEAVHAAQYCASGHPTQPLGIAISKNRQMRPFFLRYTGSRRQIEAEAYTIQTHPQKVDQAIALLDQHCH